MQHYQKCGNSPLHLLTSDDAISGLQSIIYRRFIPESIRWLHLRGREDEAKEQLAKIAAINGREMPNEDLKKFEGSGETGNFKHLFFNWKVAKITLMSWNLWWVIIVDVCKPRTISKVVNDHPYPLECNTVYVNLEVRLG